MDGLDAGGVRNWGRLDWSLQVWLRTCISPGFQPISIIDYIASHFRSKDIFNNVNWWEYQLLFLPDSCSGYSVSTKTKPSFIFISCPCSWSTEISYFLATFLIYFFPQQVPKPKHQRIQIPKHPNRPARPAQPMPMYLPRARQHFGEVDSPLFFEDLEGQQPMESWTWKILQLKKTVGPVFISWEPRVEDFQTRSDGRSDPLPLPRNKSWWLDIHMPPRNTCRNWITTWPRQV